MNNLKEKPKDTVRRFAKEIERLSSEGKLMREALELIAEPDILNPELESIGIAEKALAALVSEELPPKPPICPQCSGRHIPGTGPDGCD